MLSIFLKRVLKIKKLIFGIIIVLLILLIAFIFFKTEYKGTYLGNNISEIDILNISSYEATVEVSVISNKNQNKYIMKQKYKKENVFKQEILEPSALKGLTITSDGNMVTIENKILDLKNVYENLGGNISNLNLVSFIQNYKNGEKNETSETEEAIIMKTEIKDSKNKYQMYQNLYLDKKTNLPTKMEILDINKNVTVYILYREINVNRLKDSDMV